MCTGFNKLKLLAILQLVLYCDMHVCVRACGVCMVMDADPNNDGASAGLDDDMDVSGLYV